MQVVKYLLAATTAAFALHASAQIHQARGQSTANYKESIGTSDRKEAPGPFKQKVRQDAELKAIEAYYAEAGQSESANFDAIRSKVLQDRGRYILDSAVISETDNTKDYQYSAVVRISLNVANLRNAVQAGSSVAQAADSEKSALSFVFVSRQVDSTKKFDDRVFKRQDNSVSASGTRQDKHAVTEKSSEGESVKRAQISTYGSSSRTETQGTDIDAKSTVTSETGGSTLSRASESTWRVIPSANLNQVFVAQFSQAGYDVIESAMVESDKFKVADIESDYKSGNDLQPKTLRAVATGMKDAQIPYIALGTLDVGLATKDPQTGLMRVSVTVNAKVWDVTKAIPRTRAAVGPVAYAGVGPSDDEARSSALKLAASNAAQELSSRMTAMGMR
ncbi:MAG: hypothetical protein AMXMBFR78_16680 [Rubrivivax sp.]